MNPLHIKHFKSPNGVHQARTPTIHSPQTIVKLSLNTEFGCAHVTCANRLRGGLDTEGAVRYELPKRTALACDLGSVNTYEDL
ncbi:hypothetical protein LAUMK41_02825 [Mycobacterium attenuatum]|nr:hypothetical protein LAUMK41_02825 [Mycobacterium attenuatum]